MLGLNLGAQQIQYDGDLIEVTSKQNNVQDSSKIVQVLHFKMDSVEAGTRQEIDQIIETTVTDPNDSTQTITTYDTTYTEIQLYRDVLRRVREDGSLGRTFESLYSRRIRSHERAKAEAQRQVRQANINLRAFRRDSTKLAGVLAGTVPVKPDPKADAAYLTFLKIVDGFDEGEEAEFKGLKKNEIVKAVKSYFGINN